MGWVAGYPSSVLLIGSCWGFFGFFFFNRKTQIRSLSPALLFHYFFLLWTMIQAVTIAASAWDGSSLQLPVCFWQPDGRAPSHCRSKDNLGTRWNSRFKRRHWHCGPNLRRWGESWNDCALPRNAGLLPCLEQLAAIGYSSPRACSSEHQLASCKERKLPMWSTLPDFSINGDWSNRRRGSWGEDGIWCWWKIMSCFVLLILQCIYFYLFNWFFSLFFKI